MPTFDELVGEALPAPISGWDFSWLDWPQRRTGRLPWSYQRELARRAAQLAGPMLDVGTGGGERLSRLPCRPPRLRVVPWAVPAYSLESCRAALRAAHENSELWPASFRQRHFLLVAAKL